MECPHMPIIPYHKFSKRIHDKAASERIPLVGGIELTFRCNLKCAHCYVVYDPKKKEMTYPEICHILDEIIDAGCLWLLITGGEPFIRDDFLDIYTYAKKKGLLITLFTNGTLITPQIADHLREWQPFSVEISLYGITKETYESITGVPGSFKRCIEGINLLLERKIPFKLKTLVTILNRHEMWEIKKYAKGLGTEFRFDPIINPRLDGSKKPCQFRLSPEEVIQIDLADEDRHKGWLRFFADRVMVPIKSEYLHLCGAGSISFHLDPYGRLQLCILTRKPSYDIREGSFVEGWNSFFPKLRAQRLKGFHKCRNNCELVSLCDQCPGWSQLEHGDNETPVEYLCRVAHLRAEAFGESAILNGLRKRNKQIANNLLGKEVNQL